MPLSIPPELKRITPFVKRAEELDRDKSNPESRLVAYYCRQYAVHVGIPLATSPTGKECLGTLLGQLEEEKEAMSNFTRDESKYLCRTFADKIFDKADAEDRAGAATKNTAKTFYAAATFFEILQQFYEEGVEPTQDQEEERNKTVYSKWKATEILKAIKEGRQPTPGGYGEENNREEEEEEEQEESADAEEETEENDEDAVDDTAPDVSAPEEEKEKDDEGTEVELLGPPPEYPGDLAQPPEVFVDDRPPIAPPEPPMAPPPSFPSAPAAPPPAPAKTKASNVWFGKKKKNNSPPPSRVSNEALEDAMELTKFALSALQSKDVDLASSRLKQALASLGR